VSKTEHSSLFRDAVREEGKRVWLGWHLIKDGSVSADEAPVGGLDDLSGVVLDGQADVEHLEPKLQNFFSLSTMQLGKYVRHFSQQAFYL